MDGPEDSEDILSFPGLLVIPSSFLMSSRFRVGLLSWTVSTESEGSSEGPEHQRDRSYGVEKRAST